GGGRPPVFRVLLTPTGFRRSDERRGRLSEVPSCQEGLKRARRNRPQHACCVHPRRYQRLLSGGGEIAFTNRCPSLNCLPRKMHRRVGPERAGHFGLRAQVEVTSYSRSARTPSPRNRGELS